MPSLNCIIEAVPLYQATAALDCAISICNEEGIIVYYQPAKTFDTSAICGEKVKANGSLDKCLQTRQETSMILPKEFYGIALKVKAQPILENNVLVGVISVATSLSTQETLHDAAQSIAATTEQISATSEELAATATQLASDLDILKYASTDVIADIEKTDKILKFVSDVAASSNLLGLNAAIEAARAGEYGRGFAVVAEEIRKMADNSTEAVKEITTILQSIRAKTNGMTNTILSTAQLGERQAAASEEISASMQQLAATATDVEKISQIV